MVHTAEQVYNGERDKDVNEFEETHNVKATQSNVMSDGFVTTLFYKPEENIGYKKE